MKKIFLLIIIILLIPHVSFALSSTYSNTSSCLKDKICKTYFNIWKKEQFSRNGYNQDYFNKHIIVKNIRLDKPNPKEIIRDFFTISYDISIDWATVTVYDSLPIRIEPQGNTSPSLKLSISKYLSESEIHKAIDAGIKNTEIQWSTGSITSFIPNEKLVYKSKKEALEIMNSIDLSKKITIQGPVLSFDKKDKREMILFGGDQKDCQSNKLPIVVLNLFTGKYETKSVPCR